MELDVDQLNASVVVWLERNTRLITFILLFAWNLAAIYYACSSLGRAHFSAFEADLPSDFHGFSFLSLHAILIFAFLLTVICVPESCRRVRLFLTLVVLIIISYGLVVGMSPVIFWLLFIPIIIRGWMVPTIDHRTLPTSGLAAITLVSVYITLGESRLFGYAEPLFAFTSARKLQDLRITMFAIAAGAVAAVASYRAARGVARPDLIEAHWSSDISPTSPLGILVAIAKHFFLKIVQFWTIFFAQIKQLSTGLFSNDIIWKILRVSLQIILLLLTAKSLPTLNQSFIDHIQASGLLGANPQYIPLVKLSIFIFATIIVTFILRATIIWPGPADSKLAEQYALFVISILGASAFGSIAAWVVSGFEIVDLRGFGPSDGAPTVLVLVITLGLLAWAVSNLLDRFRKVRNAKRNNLFDIETTPDSSL